MQLFKKQTKIFHNIFSLKRAVFVVFVASVLVLGFSVNVSLAATIPGPAPVPGQPLPDAWQQAKKNYTGTYQTNLNSWTSNNNTPTSPNDYAMVLKFYGGYSQADINKAGIANTSSFIPDPVNNSKLRSWFGTTDDEFLKEWKNGRDVPEPSASQQAVNDANNGTRVAGNVMRESLIEGVLSVVVGVLAILAYFCKGLVFVGARTLDLALTPSLYNFTSSELIVKGWTVVRDVCNLFFLLVLLFIALCTILKIEKYHAKKTLLMLIIMALLINFSKPIAIFIFDGSQLLMNFFLSQMSGTMGGGGTSVSSIYMNATKITNMIYTALPPVGGSADIAVQYLFAVVFLFMLAVAFFVIGIFLLIRIVVIMMLIIVSPFAFFAAIVPDFSKMSSQWWSSLFEYSYYGPAAAFFLLLATNLPNAIPKLPTVQIAQGDFISNIVSNILQYSTTIIFLYASIFMAKKFGGGAGAAVVGNANRFMKWGAGMGKGHGMWGAGARGVAYGAKTTGVSGAVSQRLQQSKLGRLFTKSGREEALEEREAALAEKIGVKGAKARQVQKRAKKLKDEHYSEAALKAMVAKGDEAAAYRLAEDGDLDEADYAKLAVKFKGKDDPVKKLIDGKLKDKRMDVLVNYRINTEATTAGVVDPVKSEQIAEEEFGKLSPSKWKDQNIEKMTGYDPVLKAHAIDPASTARRNAANKVYTGFNAKNKDKATDDMTGAKYAAGDGIIW